MSGEPASCGRSPTGGAPRRTASACVGTAQRVVPETIALVATRLAAASHAAPAVAPSAVRRIASAITEIAARAVTSSAVPGITSTASPIVARLPAPLTVAVIVTVSILALALPPGTARAAAIEPGITLSVDARSVHAGDGVTVEIEAIGLLEPLDLSPLYRDADLVRESGGTRIGVVGGRVVEVRTRRVELLPRAEGTAFFGPLSGESIGGTVRSNALAVEVLPPPEIDWRPDATDVDVAFTLSSATPVVGERVVADLVLRHRHAITDEEIVLPGFDGVDVLAVLERRRTVVEDGDGAWRQIAWRWLLFPRRSGPLAIEPVRWSGEMVRSRTQRGRFEARAEAPALDVAPAPTDTGGWWLPAERVTLEERWSGDVRELSAGEEVVRTIVLEAEGVLAAQLPTVRPFESRSITSTPIGERREQRLVGDRVLASATFDFRLRATSPVPVFLDTVRVGWWDTAAREPRESIVPARRINVGLPERADLLQSLALRERPLERVRLWLAGLGDLEGALWVTLGLLAVCTLALLRPRSGRAARPRSVLPPV